MTRGKSLVIVSLLATLIIVLVGCSQPASSPAPAPTVTATATVTTTITTTATPTPQTATPSPTPTTAPQFSMRLASTVPATHPQGREFSRFADRVNERAKGKLKITFMTYAELPAFKSTEALTLLKDGSLDLSLVANILLAGSDPLLSASELPYITRSLPDAQKALDIAKPYYEPVFAKYNAVPLAYTWLPGLHFWFTKPVESLADVKGLKVRVFSPETSELVTGMGGSPITLASGEVSAALDRGTIEGVMTLASSLGTMGWAASIKSGIWINSPFTISMLMIGKQQLDKLPKDLQDIVWQSAKEMETELYKYPTVWEGEGVIDVLQRGIEINTLPKDDQAKMLELARAVWDNWAKRAGGQANELLSAIRKALNY
ncbi:MAG: TRAP transporter substrate-binding protein DctP [Chloroflexi bacterium]|nr:TRAP transporter substrate-binding protein DctP [Chloroflexota bacterium]